MALFSIFGKKTQQSDDPTADKSAAEAGADDVLMRQSDSIKSRRDAARKTAEKIDAIESEITRDILKNPPPKRGVGEAAGVKALPNDDVDSDYPSSNLFHTTLIRVDKETMILFKEDMDE